MLAGMVCGSCSDRKKSLNRWLVRNEVKREFYSFKLLKVICEILAQAAIWIGVICCYFWVYCSSVVVRETDGEA